MSVLPRRVKFQILGLENLAGCFWPQTKNSVPGLALKDVGAGGRFIGVFTASYKMFFARRQ